MPLSPDFFNGYKAIPASMFYDFQQYDLTDVFGSKKVLIYNRHAMTFSCIHSDLNGSSLDITKATKYSIKEALGVVSKLKDTREIYFLTEAEVKPVEKTIGNIFIDGRSENIIEDGSGNLFVKTENISIPYNGKNPHRDIVFGVSCEERNVSTSSYGENKIHRFVETIISVNGKPIIKFSSLSMSFGLAKAQYYIGRIGDLPFNILDLHQLKDININGYSGEFRVDSPFPLHDRSIRFQNIPNIHILDTPDNHITVHKELFDAEIFWA